MAKIIAFYLPQYHCFPENDEWWGKGFTEWTNVKKARPLFKNHYQPREPYNDYYYNLLDSNSRKWQADLAKEYGIYGFCYYHYWFNGKLLLHKPLEQVLKLREPVMPFCMCWANEAWTRTWDGGENHILMPQKYGEKEDWKRHFDYLLQFFKDSRYILINNKPVFVIYRTSNINCLNAMIEYWNELSIKNGFSGIYIVEMLNTFQNKTYSNLSESVVEFEPMYTLATLSFKYKVKRKIKRILGKFKYGSVLKLNDYDSIWNIIINRKNNFIDKKVIPGAFVDWDNSARKGKRGTIFQGASPAKFEKYLQKQVYKADNVYKSDLVFINAWNEWGEGTYLEPDKKNGYDYLEAIKKITDASYK